MGRLVWVFPGSPEPGDPAPELAPVIDGVPDLTFSCRRHATDELPTAAGPSRVWIGFSDEEGTCALL